MKGSIPVKAPTSKEMLTLRIMILLGVVFMVYFLRGIISDKVQGYPLLYWLLVAGFIFSCLRTLHEWYHYFHISIPTPPEKTKTYTVDIFTTYCAGEPYEMITETLRAIKAITYPHESYLCDESNDPHLRDFCQTLGIHYITRIDKTDAKAGNINNALRQSSGELCVILDPDHVPSPDFLDPIVDHFNNPEIGFVQIVQAYKNHRESLIAKGAAQQTYQFYGPMMMSMNQYGTVQAIGANCTFKRTALESIGGHAAGLAEDLHTSMQLHAKGWKSVYVPAVVARGLVPTTLSAYYKQQLKWSKGVFDLLFKVYPKLFSRFTWRQKLHYGVIPFHYLSGIIVLIDLLTPILSLFLGVSPMHLDLYKFGLLASPLILSMVVIRLFVQWWVMEDEERGFHVIGGLLIIGTWWVYILGLFYACIGKKVPYVPTPKDGNEKNNWPLNLPNILFLALSVAAIFYGLNHDWNPYSVWMAGFAGLNSFILGFTIVISQQQQLKLPQQQFSILHSVQAGIQEAKGRLWLTRRKIYKRVRSSALLIILSGTMGTAYLTLSMIPTPYSPPNHKEDYFLLGVSYPGTLDNVQQVAASPATSKTISPDFKAYFLRWGETPATTSLKETYEMGSIPMLRWGLLSTDAAPSDRMPDHSPAIALFTKIRKGEFDAYLSEVAQQIQELRRPVFLSIAPEIDHHIQRSDTTTTQLAAEYKNAWKYIHQFFQKNGVYTVIWVWHTTNPHSANLFFPGTRLVDWVSVSPIGKNSTQRELLDEYRAFREVPFIQSGLPVLLTHSGNVTLHGSVKESFRKIFPEVKGIVFADDKTYQNEANLASLKPALALSTLWGATKVTMERQSPPLASLLPQKPAKKSVGFEPNIRGINYRKGLDWDKSEYIFTRQDLLSDFSQIKDLGFTTIKRFGPGIYDRNVLRAARQFDFSIHYSFWISEEIDFIQDQETLNELTDQILTTVRRYRKDPTIVAWNIGNAVFQKLSQHHYHPELMFQQDACLVWLRTLIREIKQIDPERPVSIDVATVHNLESTTQRIHQYIPEVDVFGLVVGRDGLPESLSLPFPYFYSYIDPAHKGIKFDKKVGHFISAWQDTKTTQRVYLDGLLDSKGRSKPSIAKIGTSLQPAPPTSGSEAIFSILKPALPTLPKSQLVYNAVLWQEKRWVYASGLGDRTTYEWKLLKTDQTGRHIAIQEVGNGPAVKLTIPEQPQHYQLYLYVIQNNKIISIINTPLNTPLYTTSEQM